MNPLTKKVIIFDDSPVWLKTLRLWCNHYGFRDVTCLSTENQILEICKEQYSEIDLIVIDFYNGKENTTKLFKKLRTINPNFLIIVVSADFVNDTEVLDTKEMMKAMMAGASRVSIKDINKLKDIIIEHLTLRESELYDNMDTTKTYIFEDLGE